MSEDLQAHVKLYKKIGAALLVLTVVTVAASYLELGIALGVTVALAIAVTKGSLVASYFVHLISERKSIYAALLLTAFFFVFLLLMPILGHNDTIGERMILSNANAPSAAEAAH